MKTQIHRAATGIVITLLLTGCQAQNGPSKTPTQGSTSSSRPSPNISATPPPSASATPPSSASATPEASSNTKNKPTEKTTVVVATYQSCTAYAGSTDFYFKDGAGKTYEFRNPNSEEEKPNVVVSVELTERSEENEGPPEANPIWLGKPFALTLSQEGKVLAIAVAKPNEVANPKKEASVAASCLMLDLPKGFTSETVEGLEGTSIFVRRGGKAEVHFFFPSSTSYWKNDVFGDQGLMATNKWTIQKRERLTQPDPVWAKSPAPFMSEDGTEGVLWLGKNRGRPFTVTVRAPQAELDEFYKQVTPMLKILKFKAR